jgi:hypothetical protein
MEKSSNEKILTFSVDAVTSDWTFVILPPVKRICIPVM